MFLKPTNILLKNLTLVGRSQLVSLKSNGSYFGQNTVRAFMTNDSQRFSDPMPNSDVKLAPPKRYTNVFALFVKDCFPTLPSHLSNTERFRLASEKWRELSVDELDVYKKRFTEELVRYREEMTQFYDSMSAEERQVYDKEKKEKTKQRIRYKIRAILRKLECPKRAKNAYLYYLTEELENKYPDGNRPSVRDPEHVRWIGVISQKWKNLSTEEKSPYQEKANEDRRRYERDVQAWKQKLAEPEHEKELLELENLSRRVENLKSSGDKNKKKSKGRKSNKAEESEDSD